jgi:CHAD domain-containing protein
MVTGNTEGYLDGLLEQLRTHAATAILRRDEEAVHDARVATRRLGAALKLLAPVLEPHRRLSRTLRKLRRRLGPVRDLDVMIGHLAEDHPEDTCPAADWLREELEDQRRTAREELGRRAGLLGKLQPECVPWRGLEDGRVQELLREGLPPLVEHWETCARALGTEKSLDAHELRVLGKQLRYTLELAAQAGLEVPEDLLKRFKRLQDELGLWHDGVVLCQAALAAAMDGERAYTDSRLFGQLLELGQAQWNLAQERLGRFRQLWAAVGSEVCQQIEQLLVAALPSVMIAPEAAVSAPTEVLNLTPDELALLRTPRTEAT